MMPQIPRSFCVQLQLKTWQFVEDYLKTKTGIIIRSARPSSTARPA
jgi:hypothetical protein